MGGFFFILPAILLSGFITPVEAMPAWIQPVTLVIPVRWFVRSSAAPCCAARASPTSAPALATLTGLGIAFLLLAAWRFQRTIA